ncbi:MAG: retropepsin-like aspartic protease, partial [Anaerolineales bacterium]
ETVQLQLKDNLPFITLVIGYQGKTAIISDVLVDTGSASTILAADSLIRVGIEPSPEDTLHTIRGVGGIEVVYLRKVDFLEVGENKILDFEIEVGGMDYGFELNGIVGMDFLQAAKAIIDLHAMKIHFY